MSSSVSDQRAVNEIRVRKKSEPLKFVYEAFCLLENEDEVVFSGIGMAINHVVEVAEMTKRRIKGLHQLCELGMKDALNKKRLRIGDRRRKHGSNAVNSSSDEEHETSGKVNAVPYIKITLSKTGKGMDKNAAGYQEPLKPQDVSVQTIDEVKQELENIKYSTRYRNYYRGYLLRSQRRFRSDRERYSRDRYERERYGRDRYSRDQHSRDRHGRDRYSRDRYSRDRYGRDRFDRSRERQGRSEPFDRRLPSRGRYRLARYRNEETCAEETRARYIKRKRSYGRRI